MFRCEKCHLVSKPKESPVRVVVETREKIYPARPQAMRTDYRGVVRWIEDPGGVGTEIVREETRHAECI